MGKYFLSISFALMFLVFHSLTAEAVEVEVFATLDQHNVVYTLNISTPNTIVISGNITCNIEGLGDEIYDVTVDLWSTTQKWESSVSPPIMTFTSNGKKSFNVTINIPINTHNNTKDTISVTGLWETSFSASMIGSSGSVTPDSVNVTIYRKGYTPPPDDKDDEDDKNDGASYSWEQNKILNLAMMILLPLVVIIAIILFSHSRRRNEKL